MPNERHQCYFQNLKVTVGVMDTANTILAVRQTIFHLFRGLPLTLLSTLLLLGSFQGNVNYILFGLGLGLLVPLLVFGSTMVLDFAFELLGKVSKDTATYLTPFFYLDYGSLCTFMDVVPTGSPKPVMSVPSYWVSMISFFFIYLILNANDLYTRKIPKESDPIGVNARKTRMAMSMTVLSIVFVLVLSVRYAIMKCDTTLGFLTSIGLGGGLAYGWYTFVRNCGVGHFDDIFGISSRLLSKEASGLVSPKACVPLADEPESKSS
jgi:hypothetical protein